MSVLSWGAVMIWIEIAALIALQIQDGYRALKVFQQCHYHIDRYRDWIIERISLAAAVRRIAHYLPFLLFLLVKDAQARSGSIICIILIYLSMKLRAVKTGGASLRFTARARRLIIVLLAADAAVTAFIRTQLSIELYICLIPLLWTLPWILLPAAACIVFPLEHLIQSVYMKDAKLRLAGCRGLCVVGIGGSYGKTSVKQIAYALLSKERYTLKTPHSYNNRMGISRTIRSRLDPLHEVFLCEMGADHRGELHGLMRFVQPDITVLTAIGPQHLQTFGSMDNIVREKMRMVEDLREDGCAILNIDNPYIREWKRENPCQIITFGRSQEADVRIKDVRYDLHGAHFTLCIDGEKTAFDTKLLGECNIYNIAAAVALARKLGIGMSAIQHAVSELGYVEHRLEMKLHRDMVLIDDAFNANPEGAAAACDVLAQMPGWRILVTPGMIDLGEQQEQFNHCLGTHAASCADEVILVGGKQVQPLRQGLVEGGFDEDRIRQVMTMQEAFACFEQSPHADKVVLIENDVPDVLNR